MLAFQSRQAHLMGQGDDVVNCRTIGIVAGILAAGSVWPEYALAFDQQAPVAAQPPAVAAPAAKNAPEGFGLEANSGQPSEQKQKKGLKLPGIGEITVPKLNFGLDLMYGSPGNDSTSLNFTNDPLVGDGDLTITGKVKKRF